METSPLTCSANQWTGFYMTTASVMKELSSYSFNPQIRNMQLFTLFNQYLFVIYFLFFILELFLWGSYTSITWY